MHFVEKQPRKRHKAIAKTGDWPLRRADAADQTHAHLTANIKLLVADPVQKPRRHIVPTLHSKHTRLKSA